MENHVLKPQKIVRSSRKTIAIIVNQQGELIVRAPHRTPMRDIEKFICQKERWIHDKISQANVQNDAFENSQQKMQNSVLFLGKYYPIHAGTTPKVKISDGALVLPTAENRTALLEAWYRAQAKEILSQRVQIYAKYMQLTCKSVKITGARTRWGSCSGQNAINFTWRLILCPPEVIDYVVVHELCHIVHKNHASAFWELVAQVLPNYKEQEKWLKENRKLMEYL